MATTKRWQRLFRNTYERLNIYGRFGKSMIAMAFITTLVASGASHASKNTAKLPLPASDSLWLEELTSQEVGAAIESGKTTVIIATGGIEENGPYLSTGKHNLILQGVCPAIAKRLGDALCAPIIKFVPEGDIDPPSGHMLHPGTISLTASTYEALLTDIARSLRQSGFQDIVFIGDSGGNQRGMENVSQRLNERWAGEATRAHFVRDYYDPGWEDTERYTNEKLGISQTQNDGFHDDIWVTAMVMATDPAQARYDERVKAGLASINGVALEPLTRSIELGKQMVAFRADMTAKAIRAAIDATATAD